MALAAPQGEAIFGFLISGKHRMGMLKEIAALFAKHYVTLTSVDVDTVAPGEFVLITYADFRNAEAVASVAEMEARRPSTR